MKSNTKEQNWKLIMKIADAAMETAEKSGKKGADKKQMVIESVKASCKAAGINADEFIDQLVDYIDQTIAFVNSKALVGVPNWSPTTLTVSFVSESRSIVFTKFFPSPYSHAVRRI